MSKNEENFVKEITNTDTKTTTENPTSQVRQVISKQTAEQVKSMMETVVTDGSGRHAAVSGYSIGGKTGYVASYVAISPIEDTQLVLLLTLYDPKGKNGHQGGQVAGPVVSQMLSEILPYLGVPADEDASSNLNADNLVVVPDIRNKTVAEAEKLLKQAGFRTKVYVEGDPTTVLVADQTPKPGNSLLKDSIIVLYGQGSSISTSVTVPDLRNMNASEAINSLKSKNLNISMEGSGIVTTQDYAKDEQVQEGTVIKVTLKQILTQVH